jgi:SAM-dependent methyltransferase
MQAAAKTARLRRSRHVSFFRKKDEIFLYHDLWGYILQMDEKVHAFLAAFGDGPGRPPAEVAREFAARLRPEEIEGFIATFRQHRCLVAPRADEEADALAHGYPTRAAWTVAWAGKKEGADAPVVLAYKDRALGRVVLDRLDRVGARLHDLATGERTLEEIAARIAEELGLAPEAAAAEVARQAFRLAHSDRQVLKLTDRPLYEYLAYPPPYLRSTMPYPRLELPRKGERAGPFAAQRESGSSPEGEGGEPEASDVVDLAHFHRREIEDAQAQFDVEETTLSHMFREPHEALGGKSYGEAFADALLERGLWPLRREGRGGRVLEVGGGVGFFALRLLEALEARVPSEYAQLFYAILDLSQVLQDSQRMLTYAGGPGGAGGRAGVRFLLGNAARSLPLRDESVDLVISNEVIADFETVRLRRGDLERRDSGRTRPSAKSEHPSVIAARALVRRHTIAIDDAPDVFWLNFGALRFVEDLARALKPGGAAVLVEFGGLARYPVESTHLAHSEFSIHFGHLRHVAERVGLEVEITDIMDFLALRGDVRVLATTRTFFECLRALLARRGVSLQKIAYTERAFRDLVEPRLAGGRLEGPVFKPVRERALGLHPPEFLVAILKKPGG